MKQRKRERDVVEEEKIEFDPATNDHELFLQAFEKPTQIYRYLRARNFALPTFLYRCLSFMKKRSSRTNKRRLTFSIDSMLKEAECRQRRLSLSETNRPDYLNIAFTEFSCHQADHLTGSVQVDVSLLKIGSNRRKDVATSGASTALGTVTVPLNAPHPPGAGDQSRVLSVSNENFAQTHGPTSGRSYVLAIAVTCPQLTKGLTNGSLDHDEPVHKRPRLSSRPSEESSPIVISSGGYKAELVVYDRQRRCQLLDGEYELSLSSEEKSARRGTWETVHGSQHAGPFDVFNRQPSIKFRLSWTRTPAGCTSRAYKHGAPEPLSENNNGNVLRDICNGKPAKQKPSPAKAPPHQVVKAGSVYYQFSYNNYLRQQTEAGQDYHCPWCSLNCMDLYALLKHLRLSHARFNFSYTPSLLGACIDVSVNECYDGAYVGNPQDTHSHLGYAYCRNGPVQRTPVTHVIVYRPTRPRRVLSEFMEDDESETIRQKQIKQGHNRLYYHTVTNRPIKPTEIDEDSEGENDPEWLRQKTVLMIDEFTDVNEGEKEIMKMWNLHVMHHNYIGDCQVGAACRTFVDEYGPTIMAKKLERNFIAHLVNLNDAGLVASDTVLSSTLALYALEAALATTNG